MENQKPVKIWEPIDFTIYFSFLKWLVAVALLLEIIFRWRAGVLAGGFLFDKMEIIMWIFRFFVFAFLGWRVFKNFGHSLAVAAMAGALAGFIIGLAVSLFRFFAGVKIWKFFNLITETTLVVLLGVLVSISVVYILSLKMR
ncbi:hypothetical protein HZA71_00680 [Candidatus Falkowbacteria bacterium]|nr:hypothetical protein [Candidatus Falkowbacteria bacterium]